ncbi:MAG: hypothetical protein ACJAU6_003947 [Alphaproteobacteria bacterium]|jgi:hypothetical protein
MAALHKRAGACEKGFRLSLIARTIEGFMGTIPECPSEDLMGRMNWLSGALS